MARRKRTSAAEDFIELIAMLPWWAGLALALISYFGLRAWDAQWAAAMVSHPTMNTGILHALASLGQFVVPVVCLAGSAASAWRRTQRKALADNVSASKTADVLDGMSWREFELLVGEGFRLKGFSVVETGGGGADGGIDLVLRKGGEKHLVQCKQWRAYKVGVQVVRELYGAMAACGAAGGFVVTSGRFTEDARAFAEGRNVALMDGDALFKMIRSVRGASASARSDEPVRRAESKPATSSAELDAIDTPLMPMCPRCAGPMVRRVAKKGANAGESFLGCSAFPKCRGTA